MRRVFFTILFGTLASTALAQPLSEAQKRRVLLPYIRSATDCIAQATLQIPAAIEAAQQNRGADLAGTAGRACLEPLGKMVQAHDALHGPNTGIVFFEGPYTGDLPRAVLTRIQPELARRAAEAERAEAARQAEMARQEAQTKQVEEERRKLIQEANTEHHACIRQNMVELVPFSNEAAETVAIAIMAKCSEHETKLARLAAALYGISADQVKPIVAESTEKLRKDVISEIVTFRAERAKGSIESQRPSSQSSPTVPAGKMY